MWSLNNQTPFEAERAWCRDRRGAEVWIVAIKGTFRVDETKGALMLDERQEPVSLAPRFRSASEASSLDCDTDLCLSKDATDVLVKGSACSPSGKAVPHVDVSLAIGRTVKRLRVTGDRVWRRGLARLVPSAPKFFSTMPIEYERAYGGVDPSGEERASWDERNPVGRGFYLNRQRALGMPLPNVEYPGDPVRTWKDRAAPAGFGPVAGHWKPRSEHGGTYDAAWERDLAPLLPSDFDERFYQAAPLDQQVSGHLRGGESIAVHNMSPSGSFAFRVPRISIGLQTEFEHGPSVHHQTRIHTVQIFATDQKFSVTWHSSLECHERVHALRESSIYIKRPLHRAQVEATPWLE